MFPVKGKAHPRLTAGLLQKIRCCLRSDAFLPFASAFPRNLVCTTRSQNHRQLQGCAHCTPPVNSATAQIRVSGLRLGRPRRFLLSGDGNSFNFCSQFRQYTPPCVWARYQRHPHPSQIFNCTRNSMTDSPLILHPLEPPYLFTAGRTELAGNPDFLPGVAIAACSLVYFVMYSRRRYWNIRFGLFRKLSSIAAIRAHAGGSGPPAPIRRRMKKDAAVLLSCPRAAVNFPSGHCEMK